MTLWIASPVLGRFDAESLLSLFLEASLLITLEGLSNLRTRLNFNR